MEVVLEMPFLTFNSADIFGLEFLYHRQGSINHQTGKTNW